MNSAFKFSEVTKTYSDFTLGPLNFELSTGSITGYIGPNGAGKSTTMHCLLNLVKADSGNIEVLGKKNDLFKPQWKQNVGFVGDEHVFFEKWTCEKNLKYISGYYDNWSVEKMNELINRFEIPLQKKAKDLSTGNRVKLALAAALSHNPKLIILDEPTSGLDPLIKSELLDVLLEIMESEENSVFYSTHNLSDISRLADNLIFLYDGEIILQSEKDKLVDSWGKITFSLDEEPVSDLNKVIKINRKGNDYEVISKNHTQTLSHLRELGAHDIKKTRMNIEDISVEILKERKHVARNIG